LKADGFRPNEGLENHLFTHETFFRKLLYEIFFPISIIEISKSISFFSMSVKATRFLVAPVFRRLPIFLIISGLSQLKINLANSILEDCMSMNQRYEKAEQQTSSII